MKRTNKSFKNKIKDNFTIVPNTIINDGRLTWKALGIFSYLASKPDTWNFYMDEIKKHATDGITALRSGIKELEQYGYLIRHPRWSEKEKKYNGWTWVLTSPDIEKNNPIGNLKDRKPINKETNNIEDLEEYSNTDNSNTDNSNTKYNTPDPSGSGERDNKSSPKERTKKYIPLAKHLAKTVRSHIKYKIDAKRIKSWANDLRLLHEQNGVHPKRIKEVLSWYRKNIGGNFVPEAFSGSTFRNKFPKLEAAIKRQSSPSRNGHSKPLNTHRNKEGYQYKEYEETA